MVRKEEQPLLRISNAQGTNGIRPGSVAADGPECRGAAGAVAWRDRRASR